METSVLKQEKHTVALNSDYWEHSKNSLVDEAGETLRRKTHKEEAKMKSNVKLQEEDSEYQECSQNSRINERGIVCGQ